MTAREQGFLLLTSPLGDPQRKPLTVAQFRTLANRAKDLSRPETDRDMTSDDLVALGYGQEMARRILELLSDRELLAYYVRKGTRSGCVPITRVSEDYPVLLRKRLGLASPGCLWAKGDLSLLDMPAISLVGSRDLREHNREFAREVGIQAARQGFALVSGNARGADKIAQNACLEAGGKVISVVADSLASHKVRENVLYLSEDSFDEAFSAQRALSRNRVIHALGRLVCVAQSDLGRGGTWDGTVKNLRHGWSPVFCCRDGSEAALHLEQLGAAMTDTAYLEDISKLENCFLNFFDQ